MQQVYAAPGAAPARGQAGGASRSSRNGWTLALAGLGAFMAALDVVVVATALPTLQAQLGASLADLEWTINAYSLVFGCLMLTGAALGDRFGRRRMYVLGLLTFVAGSALAAVSSGAGMLIAARVVQGAGAAMLVPLTLTLISDAFPADKRGAAIGIWGGITGLGVAAGPVVGGAIVQGISWEWIFWVNVPVGLAVAALSAVRLTESHGPRPQLDITGMALAAAGLFLLTWAPVRAPSVGWGSPEVTGALAAGALLMAAFLAWERRAAYPMLPLAYFRRRGFAAANAVIFFQFTSVIGSLFFITQLFQIGLGYSPLGAGLRILVWMAMPMVVAPAAGALADRLGNRPFMVAGLILQAAGLGWLAAITGPGVSYGSLVAPLVTAGIGIAMCFPTVANEVTGSVPPADVGVAAGTNNALQALGGVFGVAILAAVFAANGSYATPASFIDGFKPAEWVAAAVAAIGLVAAAFAPPKRAAGRPVSPAWERVAAPPSSRHEVP
ncbi:MAG TPA: MFS transporter [Streptosporangiaceae bacterium]|nr:MFS transporter [Streptosporangiaceae bacterium]